jgi:PmbA protein
MSELLDLARKLADRASGDEQIEAFLTHEREMQVKTYAGEVESLTAAEPRGAGIRAISDGRAGFAYTTDLTETGLEEALRLARDNAKYSTPDEAVGLAAPAPSSEVEGLVDEKQADISPKQKVDFALELERATREADPRIRTVEEAMYADSEAEVVIATSTGISGSYHRTDAWCYSLAIATDNDDTEIGFEFDLARGISSLDAREVARRSAERALASLGAKKIPSARMPIVFDRYTAGQFLGVLAGALTGEAVQKGRSLFAGKLGELVANEGLSLVDDGTIPGAPGSSPWDDEGVPTMRTEVISGGVLRSFLYDVVSARREGRESTGNASRAGFKSPPGPSASNLAFGSNTTRDELMKSAGRALLVQDFHGVHSGANPISGDFSVGATGALIENGVPGRPVKEITIAAPMLEILKGITAVADDQRWLPFGGSFGGATTLVAEMTVAGI